MIEAESGLPLVNEVAETGKLRHEHGAAMSHRFERREAERLARLSDRRICKNSRPAILRLQRDRIEDRPAEVDLRRHCKIGRSTRLNSSHANISYAVFCLKKKRSI